MKIVGFTRGVKIVVLMEQICARKTVSDIERIEKCPHCGSDWGVFTKMTLINVPKNYNFDGSEGYNGEMYDNAEKIIDKPTVYCQRCGKAICGWDKFCVANDISPF